MLCISNQLYDVTDASGQRPNWENKTAGHGFPDFVATAITWKFCNNTGAYLPPSDILI